MFPEFTQYCGFRFGFASKEVLQNFFGGLKLWTMRVCTIILKIIFYQHYLNDFGMVGMSRNHMYICTTGDHQTSFYGSIDDMRIYKKALSATDDEM
jgi:hypothetical protein